MTKSLMKVARFYTTKLKLAAFPTSESLKPAIKAILSLHKSQYPQLTSIKNISNVEVQNTIDYVHVSFVLDVDKKDYEEESITARKNIIVPLLEKDLPGYFGHATMKVDYAEYPV